MELRTQIIQFVFIAFGLILLGRLFFMQVLDGSYQEKAQRNSIRVKTMYPARGLVVDRKNKLVVNNDPVFDLVITPKEIKNLDTLKLCEILDISKDTFDEIIVNMKKSKGYSPYKPQVFFKQIPDLIYARLQEYLYQFPGIYSQARTIRQYPQPYAAHTLGYIGEINQQQLDTSTYYKLGDYIGIKGIEKTYEEILRGERGEHLVVVDVHNREVGKYKGGSDDKDPTAGTDIKLSLDIELQKYAEKLMLNKKGSVVAIEPATGEILTLVSSPGYDPNWLTGRIRGEGMKRLRNDSINQPLFNRALMANYPPGSTFKPLMALLALQDGVIGADYFYGCYGGYRLSKYKTVGCHSHASARNVAQAIQHSCNAYFCHLFKLFIEQDEQQDIVKGLSRWKKYLSEFGLGANPKLDLPALSGSIPGPETYNQIYKKELALGNMWRSHWIISLGIGQGEMGTTPLQLAQMTTIIANRGTYYYPHVVIPNKNDVSNIYNQKQKVSIRPEFFEPVIDGMEKVVLAGTATNAYVPGLDICGKTGTAENPHGDDHSLFIAFAPKDNPKIALAVVVENAGFGSKYGAPIASLIIEKHLKGEIQSESRKQYLEKKMIEADLINKIPEP